MGYQIWDTAIPKEIPDREEKINKCMRSIPEVFLSVIEHLKLFPGGDRVLENLKHKKVRIGIVTSSMRDALRSLYNHRLFDCFDAIFTREDGLPIKPAGDGISECLRRRRVSADHALR